MAENVFTATPTIRGKHVFAFISPQGAGPLSCPLLDGCILTGGVDINTDAQIVKRKCPSPVERNKFDLVDSFTVRGSDDISTSLSARLPADMRSLMLKLTDAGCSFDMVWASGVCSDPNDLNQFDKLEVFEGVFVVSYEHDAVGSFDDSELGDDVLESVELSVIKYFDYVRPQVVSTLTLTGGAFTDVVYCPALCTVSEECTINNADGCAFPFATAIFTGAPNQLNVYYSTDRGQSLQFTAVDGGDFTDASVSCFSGYVVIGHNGTASDYYFARQDDVLAGTAMFTAVGAGPGLSVGATNGQTMYLLGAGVFELTRTTVDTGATLVTGSAGIQMNAMSHFAGTFLAVGNGGVIERIRSGVASVVNSPTGADLVTVDMISSSTWWIGTDTGDLYWTGDGGQNWSLITNQGANPGVMFASKYIGYLSTDAALYSTVDGGCSWEEQFTGGTFCGIDVCDNGNRFIACRDGQLLVGSDELGLCIIAPPTITDPCTLAGVTASFTAGFVCGANPNEMIIELRDASFTGTTTVTGYTYEFISGPVVGPMPTGTGDLDVVVAIPGATDDVYTIRLDIAIVECGIASSATMALTIPCNILTCDGECIECDGMVLCIDGCPCA